MTLRAQVLEALGTVYDPELDEPITTLGFVGSCVVTGRGDVEVRLRLPTPQCAPNFAFLMAADARTAVRRLPGVREVTIVLEDHYTGAEINAAVGRGDGFDARVPRRDGGRPRRAARAVPAQGAARPPGAAVPGAAGRGASPEEVVALRVADLPDSAEAVRSVALRAALGLPHGPDAPGARGR